MRLWPGAANGSRPITSPWRSSTVPQSFDPVVDPLVRIEAARLRDKLREYYEADGRGDPIRIELPKGSYTPHVEFRQAPTAERGPDRQGPVIAVLPFVNLSGDPKQEYFSDGLTEDIMTELSRARDLRVLARNTTFQYKGKTVDVSKLGRDLKVRYVLEGSVRRTDDRLRVTAQLIDTETGTHVWADRFDRELADVFLVQDEIVGQIVAKIAGSFGVIEIAEGRSATRKNPDEIQAYDLVLRAHDVMLWEWSRANFRSAKELLRQAIALDPVERAGAPRAGLACFDGLGVPLRRDPSARAGDHGAGDQGGSARPRRRAGADGARGRILFRQAARSVRASSPAGDGACPLRCRDPSYSRGHDRLLGTVAARSGFSDQGQRT